MLQIQSAVKCSKCEKRRSGVFLLRDGRSICWRCLHPQRQARSYASPAEELALTRERDVAAFDAMTAARPLKPPGAS